jgi:hypothetical protein
VLVPKDPNARNYGRNPHVGYDATSQKPFLYDRTLPESVEPMERVVAVETAAGHRALTLLRRRGAIQSGDLFIQLKQGQASALDNASVAKGRDIGNVIVQKRLGDRLVDVPYDVTFAFGPRPRGPACASGP